MNGEHCFDIAIAVVMLAIVCFFAGYAIIDGIVHHGPLAHQQGELKCR